MNKNTKFWTNPFSIGVFILFAITGLLVLLHAVTGMSQSTQLWLSSLFVVAVVIHTAVNWKQFT